MKLKRVIAISLLLAVTLAFFTQAEGSNAAQRMDEEPLYQSFNYIYDGKSNGVVSVLSPAAYKPVCVVDAASLGTSLSEPVDLFVYGDEIYIVDETGSKIIVTDSDFTVQKEITGFLWQGKPETFKNPEGVFVTADKIYVADTDNQRIVILNKAGECVTILTAPQSELLSGDLVFEPLKVAVDQYGRIYTVVKGVYEGIMELYEDGSFAGFVGSIPVSVNPLQRFWKAIMSKEARSKLQNFIPVEYTNLTVDSSGFLYATSLADENNTSIRRLNSAGSDILVRNALGNIPVNGVVTTAGLDEVSDFADVAAGEKGIFYALDRKYGRIFVYDDFGNLLYVLGGTYSGQTGTFQRASAIALSGDRVLISDMSSGSITVFERTEYAAQVVKALALYDDDQYEESIAAWNQVLSSNRNYRLAYDKIGLALYQMGNNKEAMEAFRKAGDQKNYSKAFSRVREQAFSENFVWIILGLIVFIVLFALLSRLLHRWRKNHPLKRGSAADSLLYVFHVLLHPFDGFWDLKNEKRGRVWVSTLLILLTVVAFAMEQGMTGFALASDPFGRLEWSYVLKLVLIPLVLFLVANMSITSLMDGKGTFRQLYTAAGYALTPLILVKIPVTLISGLLTNSEAVFVQLLNTIAVLYVAVLLFAALSGTHEYTAGKTVGVLVLTGIVMVIICFICVLFFFLATEIVGFVYTIVEELRYR